MRPLLAPAPAAGLDRGEPPSFSVVIAAYEAAAYIPAAVASALEQTYPPLEVIVSDDGSSDDIEGALEPFRERIILLRGPNRGPGAARNEGFRRASGDFVVILDADDVFLPERLEALAEVAVARPDLDILTTDAFMELDGRTVRRVYDEGWSFETSDQRRAIVERNFIFGLAAVHREPLLAVGGMDEAREVIEDWDLWIRLLLEGSRAGLVAEPLARNRLRPASLSSQREWRLETRVSTLEKTVGNPRLRRNERRAARRALRDQRALLAMTRARRAVAEGEPEARRAALGVVLAPPLSPRLLRPRNRLRAAAWAIAPGAAGMRLRRIARDAWEGAGGLVHSRARVVRVAFYCDAPVIGGAERSLGTLLERLDERVEATVIGTRPHVVEWLAARRPGARGIVVPHVDRKRDLRAIAAHLFAVRRIRPDVIHFNLSGAWESHWAQLAAAVTRGTRLVVVVHLPLPAHRRRQRHVKRLTSLGVAAHVTVGERSARELERVTGLPPGSVRTIRNGVPDVPLEPLPRPRAGPIIGSLGRLVPEKGFDVLLRALPAIPEATLVLVGEGSEREALEELGEALGVAEQVVFAGWSQDARRHLTTFDVFALPSRFEAFPLSVLEAMLASLPVVASDVGSVGEAVEDGRTGLLVPPEDSEALGRALRSLLEDSDRARALGRRGRERALERFGVDAMVQAYERLYEEVAR